MKRCTHCLERKGHWAPDVGALHRKRYLLVPLSWRLSPAATTGFDAPRGDFAGCLVAGPRVEEFEAPYAEAYASTVPLSFTVEAGHII